MALILSVIRQKGESQNGCFKKAKHTKISEKQTFLTSWYAHAHYIENFSDFSDFFKVASAKSDYYVKSF